MLEGTFSHVVVHVIKESPRVVCFLYVFNQLKEKGFLTFHTLSSKDIG